MKFTRILAFLLMAVMLFAVVACGTGTQTPTKEAPETGKTEQPATDKPTEQPSGGETAAKTTEPANDQKVAKPEINESFDGETVKFFVNGGEGSVHVRSIVLGEEDDPDYEVNAKVAERNDKVQNELGVTIELTETKGMQEAYSYLQPILASKTWAYDVLALYQYFDLGLALGDTVGSFYNYLNMPEGSYINLDAKYWNQALFNTLAYKNTAFFLTGDITQTTVSTMFVSYVNATMWDQYKDAIAKLKNNPEGYTSIYDVVKNGYWTMDLWCEICNLVYEDLTNNDKIDQEDKIGTILYVEDINCMIIDMFAAGAGMTYSAFDSDGTPIVAINTPQNVAFLEKLYTLTCESKAARVPLLYDDAGEWYGLMNVFALGNVFMILDTLGGAEEYLADMTDDYYIMPLPMFDHNQFDPSSPSLGYKTQLADAVSQFAICTAAGEDRIPMITATMELMGYYSHELVTPAYYDGALKQRYTRNLEDAQIIDMIHDGIFSDFAIVWSGSLDNVTWFYRYHYTEQNKIARNLKAEQDKKTLKMKQLLVAIEEAFYVEG